MQKHKSEKIHDVVHENDRKLNLHEIKSKTGAGSGHKHISSSSPENNIATNNLHKSHNIYDVVTSIEGKANLHHIKAKTGAGNGYKHTSQITDNNIAVNSNNTISETPTHKSHRIHAIFHANDRKLNLHEIKAKTGAGSGYKHH